MKKIFLLSLILGLSVASYAQADESRTIVSQSDSTTMCGDNCNWKLYSDGTLEISGSGKMKADFYDYNSMNGTSGAPWASADVKSVIINEGITTVGSFAFSNMKNLTDVKLADSVAGIGANSFDGCSSLSNINFPEGMTYILGESLYGTALTHVELPSSLKVLDDDVFDQCNKLTSIDIPNEVELNTDYNPFDTDSLTEITCSGETCSDERKTSLIQMGISEDAFATVTATTDANGLTTYKTSDGRTTKTVDGAGVVTKYDAYGIIVGKYNADGTVYAEITPENNNISSSSTVADTPVTSYTVSTAQQRVSDLGGCEEPKCSLKMWFK